MGELTAGYLFANCKEPGGVKSIIPISRDNLDTYVVDMPNLTVTTLTSNTTCFELIPDQQMITADQNPTGNRDNGTFSNPQNVQIIFTDSNIETDKRVGELGPGYWRFVVRFQNGDNKLFGAEGLMSLVASPNTSGKAFQDLKGHTLNFEGEETEMAPFVDDATIAALLAPHS